MRLRDFCWALIVAMLMFCGCHVHIASAQVPAGASQYRGVLIREAHVVLGLDAPIPAMAGQIEQESGWRPGITAFDNGRGLAQFMDPTATWVSQHYPDIGHPAPYDPLWAIRALVRLDSYNIAHVAGATVCERWGAGLKAYNAGLGYVQRAQRRSEDPSLWFNHTELINAGQSDKNFEYSRQYPRWILLKRQAKYAAWGETLCLN